MENFEVQFFLLRNFEQKKKKKTNLKRSETWKGKQGGEEAGGDTHRGCRSDMNRVHERVSLNAADETDHINNHNLTQSNPFSQNMARTRQHHHNRCQCHCQSDGLIRELRRSNKPKHCHGRTDSLQGGIECQPTATDGVPESCICHDQDGGDVRKCRERHLTSQKKGAVHGGCSNNRACDCGAATGGEAREPQGRHQEDSGKNVNLELKVCGRIMERVQRGLSKESEKIVGFVIGTHVALRFIFIILFIISY